MNVNIVTTIHEDSVFVIKDFAILDLDVCRRFENWKIEFSDRNTGSCEILSFDRVIVAIKDDVVGLNDKAIECRRLDVIG